MDNHPLPEMGYENPGFYVPTVDASSVTTSYESYDAAFQTAEQDLKYLMNKESNRNASISTLDGSARTNQAMPATCNRYENTCSSMNSQRFFLSSLDVSREFDISVETQNHTVPYGTPLISSVPTRSWDRSVLNYRMTTETNQALKRTRPTDYEQKCINYNKTWETNTTRQTTSENNLLSGIDHKIQTIKQTVSNHPQNPLKRQAKLVGENIAYNTNVTDKSGSDAPIRVLDSIPCKRERIRSADDIVGVTGPSGFNRNVSSIDIRGGAIRSCFQLKMLSIKRDVKKALLCYVCKSEISSHMFDEEVKDVFECCICTYSSCDESHLQMHSDSHLIPKTFCNVCQREHTEGNSHDGEHMCAVCEETFHCKTKLNEHILKHRNYFKGHCWVCCKNFDLHFKEGEGVGVFSCCICPVKSRDMKNFAEHAGVHRPKIFCRICKEEYCKEQEVLHKREFMCVWCKETFSCQPMLEDHAEDNKNYFCVYCRICNKKVEEDHQIKTNKAIFYCCKCFRSFKRKYGLQLHLYTHTSLNIFKCYKCGGRFSQKEGLTTHSRSCPAVPYKCEKCHARFPRKDFLDWHCSVKHKVKQNQSIFKSEVPMTNKHPLTYPYQRQVVIEL